MFPESKGIPPQREAPLTYKTGATLVSIGLCASHAAANKRGQQICPRDSAPSVSS